MNNRVLYIWSACLILLLTVVLLGVANVFAQFSDVYGNTRGNVYGDVYMTPPSSLYTPSYQPLALPPLAPTSPSAPFFDAYGSLYQDILMTPPSRVPNYTPPPLVLPPFGSTSPSVQFGQDGLTYIYPGQGRGPAVVVPPASGQSQVYFGQNGGPDVIVTPDGVVHYMYPGKR